jgi:bis(5'-nucleosidyl)-tetraphosphatase
MSENVIREGIVLLIRNEKGKYLLLKHCSNKLWSMISGGKEPNENLIDTVVREAKEESGIDIDPENVVDLKMSIKFENKHGKNEQMAYFYEVTSPQVKIDNREICEFKWFSKKGLLEALKVKPPLIDIFNKFVNSSHF